MTRPLHPINRSHSESAFAQILERFRRSVPGCHAVAFVDYEGEAVDIAGNGDEFDVKVSGAHWLVVCAEIGALSVGGVKQIQMSGKKRSFHVKALPEGYILVVIMGTRGAFSVSERALNECAYQLSKEAHFDEMPPKPAWVHVDVIPPGPRNARPVQARGSGGSRWHEVEVLGVMVGLGERERGFLVRLDNGAEMTLLREPLGRWWSDQPIE
jgi:predicted regulator of Ras-like GTPase activity (Roadblock/LC7/MglB family)